MLVAYVCADPGVPVFGTKGASVHVQAMTGALLDRGAEVALLATRTGGEAPPALSEALVVPLPPARKGDPAERERRLLAANGALAEALGELGELDLVYERYSLWSHAAMEHARARGVPGVLEVNAPLIDEQAAHRVLVHRAEAETSTARAVAAASVIVAVSDGVAAWLARFPGAREKVHVVPNGVDPARFPDPAPVPERPFTVGFLGTLKPWHGLDTLLDAFALLHATRPDARLRIVGDGPLADHVRARLDRPGLKGAATMTGAVDPRRIALELAAMDVGVAPYPDVRPFYFSPLKLVEYAAAGLPVVCSRVGTLDQVVADGETGLLCPPGDPRALAAALARLAEAPALRARLGAAGRERVFAEHTWPAIAERILALAGLAQVGAEVAA